MAKQKLKKIPGRDLEDLKIIKKQDKKQKKEVKKIKTKKERKKIELHINYKKVLMYFSIILISLLIIFAFSSIKIKNIKVVGNEYLTDQEIIDLAGIRNYPKSLKNSSYKISKKVSKNIYIKKVKVKKSNFFKTVTITVTENKPIFFNNSLNKTILSDGSEVEEKFNVPILLNQVPNDIYKKLIDKISKINNDVLIRINEITYTPSKVDDELFLLSMNDQNYVYININTFDKLNEYLSMLKTFNNKKGLLHLDSGNYFEDFSKLETIDEIQ